MGVRGGDSRFRGLSRLVLVSLIAGGSAACSSDALRFSEPFANPFASITGGEPSTTGSLPDVSRNPPAAPPAPRAAAIQSQPLAPPSAVSSAPVATPRAPVATLAPVTPIRSAPPVASGPGGWSAQGGTPITVGPGDGLNQIATRFGVPGSAILQANGLSSAAQVTAGRQIVIPVYSATGAPVAVAAPRPVAQAPAPVAKPVAPAPAPVAEAPKRHPRPGQAVAEAKAAPAPAPKPVAEAKPVRKIEIKETPKPAEAARQAEPHRQAKVETTQKLKPEPKVAKVEPKPEPKRAEVKQAEVKHTEAKRVEAKVEVKRAEPKVEAKKAEPKPEPVKVAKVETKVEVKKPEPKPAKVVEAPKAAPVAVPAPAPVAEAKPEPAKAEPAKATFRWPAHGRVINGYGSSGNEGINIAVPEGTPVKAAEDGTVAYAGSDVKGYGKLVLVRHPNGFVSAYAHNGELDVKPGEKVRRGQTIAKSGQSGNVTSPQLHFEIRKGATPVDPMPHLASN